MYEVAHGSPHAALVAEGRVGTRRWVAVRRDVRHEERGAPGACNLQQRNPRPRRLVLLHHDALEIVLEKFSHHLIELAPINEIAASQIPNEPLAGAEISRRHDKPTLAACGTGPPILGE